MTSTPKRESVKPGWLQRTFGAAPLQQKLEKALLEITEKDAKLLDLETRASHLRALSERHSAEAASAREREEVATLALRERTTALAELQSKLTEAAEQAKAVEIKCKAEEEKARRHEQTAAAALQRADQRTAELAALQKKLLAAEARCTQLVRRQDELTQEKVRVERESAERAQELAAAEARAQSLRAELESSTRSVAAIQEAKSALEQEHQRTQTELGEQLATIARLQQIERSQRAALDERARSIARLESEGRRARDALAELQADLIAMVRLSAQALEVVLGPQLHLGVELAFRALNLPGPRGGAGDGQDPVQRVREHLVRLGLAEEFDVNRSTETWAARIRLPHQADERTPMSLVYWISAYATECLNRILPGDQRVSRVMGGPLEYEFNSAPRGEAGAPPHSPAHLARASD